MFNTEVTEATGLIKILKTPVSQVPLEIRGAWAGLILPCYPYIGYLCGEGESVWILTGTEIEGRKRGVIVPQNLAIAALSRRNLTATVWWMAHGFPQPGESFFFDESEIHIVDGVAEAPMHLDIEIS